MKRALCMTLTALVLVSCQDDSRRGPTDVAGPLLSHLPAITDNQDTYLNQVAKNANFGDSLVLSRRESAKNRVLVAFGPDAMDEAGEFLSHVSDGRVILTLTIEDNPGVWGPGGRLLERCGRRDGGLGIRRGHGARVWGSTMIRRGELARRVRERARRLPVRAGVHRRRPPHRGTVTPILA